MKTGRNNKDMLIGLVSTLALAVVVILALFHIRGLGEEIEGYKGQLEEMAEQGSEAVQRNKELATDLVMLQEELKELEGRNEANEIKTGELEILADQLENEKNELAAFLDERERQNGELLKKFDGLSKPN